MKTLLNLWVKLNEAIWGFEVSVQWEGRVYRHAAKDIKEALEWMRQYPESASCSVMSFGNDRVVVSRSCCLAAA